MRRFLALALLAGAGSPAYACDPGLVGAGTERMESERFVVAYRSVPPAIAVGEYFGLDIAVCGKDGASPDSLRVDAHMPAHRHGMNYAPKIEPAGPGRWHADGLMFHMPGLWELRFDVRAAGATDRLTRGYRLQ